MPKLPFGGYRRRFSPPHLGDFIFRPNGSPDLPLAVICLNEKTQSWQVGYHHLSARWFCDLRRADRRTLGYGQCQGLCTRTGIAQPRRLLRSRPWMSFAVPAAS